MDAALPLPDEQRIIAHERLRLLEIGYYIRAGMGVLFSLFMMLYVAMFVGMSFVPDAAWDNGNRNTSRNAVSNNAGPSLTPASSPTPVNSAPPKALFRIMGCVFGGMVLLIFVFAGMTAFAGRCLRRRRHPLFIQIVAGLNCLFVPYGTLIGVMTFLTLSLPAAKLEFEGASS